MRLTKQNPAIYGGSINLTPRVQKLIQSAYKLAKERNEKEISYIYLFAGFFNIEQNQIDVIFKNLGIDLSLINKALIKVMPHIPDIRLEVEPVLSKQSKKLFSTAKDLAAGLNHEYVGLEHVFITMFEIPDKGFEAFVNACDIPFDKIIDKVYLIFNDTQDAALEQSFNNVVSKVSPNTPILDSLAFNINKGVLEGKINNLYINKELVNKLAEILCRKNKNNPLIIGEAGVGKTALVESLAYSIVTGQCADFLGAKQIYALDISLMIAGCSLRGQFETKIKGLLKEAAANPNIVLFIDEIHTIIGAGNYQNGLDLANILKPYLARGEISCIGATTYDEYRKTILNDPALSRRFQVVKVDEPTKAETLNLVKNIKFGYEDFHGVKFNDEVLEYAVNISDRYIEGRFPDKVIDLMDQAGSKAKLASFIKTKKMIAIEKESSSINYDEHTEEEIQAKLKVIVDKYTNEVEKLIAKWKNSKNRISKDDILRVVADKTNISFEELKREDSGRLKAAKDKLINKLVGQNPQIDQIYKCLVRGKAGFNKKGPISSFLFAGPSGVGKTFSCQILAESLFLNKNNFISLDMSEYSDKGAANKLIGSPVGYIDSEKGGFLCESVRKNPYCIVLLDEIQKAHSDVISLLFQILDEGKLTDSFGRVVNFSNTIIVMTTNIGNSAASSIMGFNKSQNDSSSATLSEVKKFFPVDFLNRIDEIVIFNELSESQVKEVINREVNVFIELLKGRGVGTVQTGGIVDFIFNKIKIDGLGARQAIKTVQRELETLVAEKLIETPAAQSIEINIENNQIKVK